MVNTKKLLQVLYEHIFMKTSKDICNYHKLQGQGYNGGNTIIYTIVRKLIHNCLKSIDEETLLKSNDRNMGECRDHIIVNRTPKCHSDI